MDGTKKISEEKVNWVAISTITGVVALIVALGFNTSGTLSLIKASKAQRLATELQIFSQAYKTVNDSSKEFNKLYYKDLQDYILDNNKSEFSKEGWAALKQMMNYTEYLALLINENYVTLEKATEPVATGLIPLIVNYFVASKKDKNDETLAYIEKHYPQCLKLIKTQKPDILNKMNLNKE